MGGSPNSDSNAPLRTGGSQGLPVQFVPQQKWNIESTHPEALYNGIAQGIGSLAMGAAALKAPKPNAAGGFNTQQDAQSAAQYAAGFSQDEAGNWFPRAKGISYQPDQMERQFGYGRSF